MADSRVALEAEDWVRREWLPQKYSQKFHRERLQLSAGGAFDFDAVSEDNTIIANISTSGGVTSGGNIPSAKLQKLRADMLFLTMIEAEKKLIILTEKDMFDLCQKEKQNGRVPLEIKFIHAESPETLAKSLKEARAIASREVSPQKQ